jgi:hypothetical protein
VDGRRGIERSRHDPRIHEVVLVPIFHGGLEGRLKDELGRRGADDFEHGERVVIEQLAKRPSKTTGREMVPYRVEFPDRPRRTARAVLGAPTTEPFERYEDE